MPKKEEQEEEEENIDREFTTTTKGETVEENAWEEERRSLTAEQRRERLKIQTRTISELKKHNDFLPGLGFFEFDNVRTHTRWAGKYPYVDAFFVASLRPPTPTPRPRTSMATTKTTTTSSIDATSSARGSLLYVGSRLLNLSFAKDNITLQKTSSATSKFEDQLQDCKRHKKRFIPIYIGRSAGENRHANVALLDAVTNSVYLFEPHGETKHAKAFAGVLGGIIRRKFGLETSTNEGSVGGSSSGCIASDAMSPAGSGPQTLEMTSRVRNALMHVGFAGRCASWCTLFLQCCFYVASAAADVGTDNKRAYQQKQQWDWVIQLEQHLRKLGPDILATLIQGYTAHLVNELESETSAAHQMLRHNYPNGIPASLRLVHFRLSSSSSALPSCPSSSSSMITAAPSILVKAKPQPSSSKAHKLATKDIKTKSKRSRADINVYLTYPGKKQKILLYVSPDTWNDKTFTWRQLIKQFDKLNPSLAFNTSAVYLYLEPSHLLLNRPESILPPDTPLSSFIDVGKVSKSKKYREINLLASKKALWTVVSMSFTCDETEDFKNWTKSRYTSKAQQKQMMTSDEKKAKKEQKTEIITVNTATTTTITTETKKKKITTKKNAAATNKKKKGLFGRPRKEICSWIADQEKKTFLKGLKYSDAAVPDFADSPELASYIDQRESSQEKKKKKAKQEQQQQQPNNDGEESDDEHDSTISKEEESKLLKKVRGNGAKMAASDRKSLLRFIKRQPQSTGVTAYVHRLVQRRLPYLCQDVERLKALLATRQPDHPLLQNTEQKNGKQDENKKEDDGIVDRDAIVLCVA